MAKCGAGDCEVECGGRGCGCIAESDNPEVCACFCFGGEGPTGGGLNFEPTTRVDVSLLELQLIEAATFLDAVCTTRLLVPADRASERVALDVRRTPLGDVLRDLHLADGSGDDQPGPRGGLLHFAAGLVIGGVLSRLVR